MQIVILLLVFFIAIGNSISFAKNSIIESVEFSELVDEDTSKNEKESEKETEEAKILSHIVVSLINLNEVNIFRYPEQFDALPTQHLNQITPPPELV